MFAVLIALAVVIFGFTYLRQSLSAKKPPKDPTLAIYEPKDGTTVESDVVTVRGKTDPECLFFYNGNVEGTDDKGGFNFKVDLVEGKNKFVFSSTNQAGKKITKEIVVTYEPPQKKAVQPEDNKTPTDVTDPPLEYGKETCTLCEGNGQQVCSVCDGRGRIVCTTCSGLRTVLVGSESITCSSCQGTGWITCTVCIGSGVETCRRCGGSGRI